MFVTSSWLSQQLMPGLPETAPAAKAHDGDEQANLMTSCFWSPNLKHNFGRDGSPDIKLFSVFKKNKFINGLNVQQIPFKEGISN